MNHFEERLKKILELLLQSDGYLTLDFLSQHVGISKRSVQNYMHKLEDWLSDIGLMNIVFHKKQGQGLRLLISDDDRRKLEDLLNGEKFSLFDEGVVRRLEMLKALIFSNDELTIQFFADQFYISRTAILKDLEWVSQWLSNFDLQLFKTQRRGIGIIGNEVSRRNAIAGFFDIYKTREQLLMTDFDSTSRISDEKLLRVKDVYPKIDNKPVFAIIEDAEKKFDFFLTNEFFVALVTHLIICIARLSSGKNVDECFLPPEGEYGRLERSTADYIASRIEKEFSLSFPESERIYICMHLMSYNTFNHHALRANPDEILKDIPKKIELLAICLIDYVDAQLGSSFASDKLLFFGILFHLKNSLERLEESIPINTIQRNEFSKKNLEIFNAVSKSSNLYEGICGVKPSEEELIILTMHFTLSQKRTIKKKKALLVCDSGISAGIMLCKYLSELSLDLEIVDVCSTYQYTYKAENEYDFIISTTPLRETRKPTADLSTVTKTNYGKFLEDYLFSLG
ncbi:PRD domain-containing protein [Anoxybacterium hadale]|uniref:PRD domain-containing protein n=1 Tax=Anoxybacterium hadale TaxID=3408580 RepID=A0ACD1ABU3_9FIRM|nr:PRD domain-containing protein [Clostridiales bacterium]